MRGCRAACGSGGAPLAHVARDVMAVRAVTVKNPGKEDIAGAQLVPDAERVLSSRRSAGESEGARMCRVRGRERGLRRGQPGGKR